MFSLYEYPIQSQHGLQLCREHARQLEVKAGVIYDKEAPEKSLIG
jgi:hypothetical protein